MAYRYGRMEWDKVNKYPGRCRQCGVEVPVGAGYVTRSGEGWATYCRGCALCPQCGASKLPRYPTCYDCHADPED